MENVNTMSFLDTFNALFFISCLVHIILKSYLKILFPVSLFIVFFIYTPHFNLRVKPLLNLTILENGTANGVA